MYANTTASADASASSIGRVAASLPATPKLREGGCEAQAATIISAVDRVSQRRGYSGILFDGASPDASFRQARKSQIRLARSIKKRAEPNEKILMRVYSQGRSGYVALEAK